MPRWMPGLALVLAGAAAGFGVHAVPSPRYTPPCAAHCEGDSTAQTFPTRQHAPVIPPGGVYVIRSRGRSAALPFSLVSNRLAVWFAVSSPFISHPKFGPAPSTHCWTSATRAGEVNVYRPSLPTRSVALGVPE